VSKDSLSNEEVRDKKEKKHFEILDHTADIGLIIYGQDLRTLFEHAGEAFFYLITDLERVGQKEERRVELKRESLEQLMVGWLNELLYLHEVEGLLFNTFKVEAVNEDGLKARVKGDVFKDGVHIIKTEVKAVTYHQIQVKKEGGGWRAQVIVDL
jgi:SHS2 domain-containing protein